MQEKKLIFSIITTLCALFAIQMTTISIVSYVYNMDFRLRNWYIPTALVTHVTSAILLCLFTKEFQTIPHGEPLKQVTFVNAMSLFRISSTPTLVLFVTTPHKGRINTIIIVWMAIIFASDFLDGKLARRLKKVTRIGKYIDSWSDYLILLVISVLLYTNAFIPLWFFVSALTRIVIPICGILTLYIINRNTHYHTSWFGKASIFAIMTVFCFSLTRTLFRDIQLHQKIITTIGIIAAIGFIIPALINWAINIAQCARKQTSRLKEIALE